MAAPSVPTGIDSSEPSFSLVIPVYNVEPFLPAFLDSLTQQRAPLTDCELIFVNDGSTDGSAALIAEWIARTGHPAEVIDQANQGLCAARNAGLERASGTWVSFPDPDDTLDPDYFGRVRAFLVSRTVESDLVCTHTLILDDETGELSDTHPLSRKFADGSRVVNLEQSPEIVHLSAASAFYRRARIEQLGLRFDASIRPHFEDASFTTLYLIASRPPRLGIVADALYAYRKRADASSLVQRSWALEGKYTTLLELGYLALLRRVAEQHGSVPTWVQNLILYDLLFFFRTDQSANSATAVAKVAWTDRFHELAGEILEYIDVETIDGFSVMPTSNQLRAVLVIGYKGERRVPASLHLDTLDADQRLVRIRYFYGGPAPDEKLLIDGSPALPAYAKTRDLTYLNRILLHERIAWVPATAEIRVAINGRLMPLEFGPRPNPIYAARPAMTWLRMNQRRGPPPAPIPGAPDGVDVTQSVEERLRTALRTRFPGAVRTVRRFQYSLTGGGPRPKHVRAIAAAANTFGALDPAQDARVTLAASGWGARRRYARAWTFMDRDTEAHDNAEHLYRHVRRHHPEVNAWFVLRRDSTDWDRLASEGFRLVPFGTADHVQLLLNTDHLVSSQVDNYVVRPLDSGRFGTRAWRFTFLQHGVTKDDLSRWLNPKPIDRFITASTGEHAGVVGDHSPYVFTEKEVRLTGFPRHDRLLELKRGVDRPSLILIMPTWRRWLLTGATSGNTRQLKDPLATTEFGRSWFDLIGSTALKDMADASGLEIAFVPHPNMHEHISSDDVPPWVSIHSYQTSDIQELLARAAVTVSDYSSQAFEAAYLECPIVYYQFDHEAFFSGTHVYRKGAWDYETDGFGPVAVTGAEALEAIGAAIARGTPAEPYFARMRAAFPHRDGRCCERTFASIQALTTPAAYEEAFHFLSDDQSRRDDVTGITEAPPPVGGAAPADGKAAVRPAGTLRPAPPRPVAVDDPTANR